MPLAPPDSVENEETTPMSLRERKKAKTRAALIEVSQRLFDEQGYSTTTLDQICAEVEITAPTLLRYFDSKARLALAPMTEPLQELEQFLEDPRRAADTLAVWLDFVTSESLEASNPTSPASVSYMHNLRAYRQLVDKDPGLVAMASDVERWLRQMLARSLAVDAGAGPEDLHAALLASLLVTGRTVVWERWLGSETDTGSLLDDHLSVIDSVVTCLPRQAVPDLTVGSVHPLES